MRVPREARSERAGRRLAGALVAASCLVATVALAGCGGRSSSASGAAGGSLAPPGPARAGAAIVTRVVDGDTIAVRFGTGSSATTEKVRLIGIDTPESVKPNTPVQCFAIEASKRTKALLPPGTAVRLERDVEPRDVYHRLLAYVYRSSDGLFVNLSLARDGFAVLDTFPPNVAHVDDFTAAVSTARDANLGLWGSCGDNIPHHPASPLPSPP